METKGTWKTTIFLPKVCRSNFQNKIMWNFRALKYLKLWPWDLKNSLEEGRENCAEVGNTWIAAETIWFLKYQFAHVCSCSKGVWWFLMEFLFTKSRTIFLPKKTHGDPHSSNCVAFVADSLTWRRSWIHVIARCCWWCGSRFTVLTSRSDLVS